jgi:unsaturated chondroitin disaccharide hydrolase
MNESAWNEAIGRMRGRMERTAEATASQGFPHYADPQTGNWTCTPAGDWTGGYWNAMLWLSTESAADGADRDRYLGWARQWTERLRPRIHSNSSSRGILFYYGAASGAILTNDKGARGLALEAAKSLAAMYNPHAEVIPMGTEFEEVASVGMSESEVDVVQIAALLLWASRETGDRTLQEIAVKHARRHIELCVRDDGSICQSASFDPETGKMTRRYTHKGITDKSTWARAQAWAILGWALTAQWSGDMGFLEPAERAADWWIDHVPADRIAFWDFDDPAIPATNRDTSATAITASGLLKLAALTRSEERRRIYRDAAETTVRALVDGYLGPEGGLWKGCYNKRIGLAVENELIWGTYYLFEALHVLAGALSPTRI